MMRNYRESLRMRREIMLNRRKSTGDTMENNCIYVPEQYNNLEIKTKPILSKNSDLPSKPTSQKSKISPLSLTPKSPNYSFSPSKCPNNHINSPGTPPPKPTKPKPYRISPSSTCTNSSTFLLAQEKSYQLSRIEFNEEALDLSNYPLKSDVLPDSMKNFHNHKNKLYKWFVKIYSIV